MKRVAIAVVVLAVLGGTGWLVMQRFATALPPDTLYGNVEIRQVDLAFNAEGRVATMTCREGDAVHAGEVIATLDDASYRNLHDLALARRDQAQANLALLLAGTRAEDIDQARAEVASAEANATHAQAMFARQADLVKRNATPRQDYEDARMAQDAGLARLAQTRAALAEALAGPRAQQIDAARAALRQAEASVALSAELLSHTRLTAPADGVVITAGDRARHGGPADSGGLFNGDRRRGLGARLRARAAARPRRPRPRGAGAHRWRRRRSAGRIGYLSPVAEFTPKTVETPELRTQLVYRLRIRIEKPDNGLRQGMPVTIALGK